MVLAETRCSTSPIPNGQTPRQLLKGSYDNLHNEQGHLRVSNVLQDFIYFDFWIFSLLLAPLYAYQTMSYVAEKGIIYITPYVAAFGMIYFKSFIHVKDWALEKWVDYKDF